MKAESQDPVIDPGKLSERPILFRGTVAPADLERLDDLVANGEGELRYEVTAQLEPQRRKVVSCTIEGFVFLTCQVSLDTFRHPVSIRDRLVLVDSEAELPPIEEESETEDHVVVDGPLEVLDLVEDAVLLALPMMPRKPGSENVEAPESARGETRSSPFAKLSSLKRSQ
jgi:uncharacterized protein